MHRPRRVPVWIAALAVLLHLFAMPLMAGGARGSGFVAAHCAMADAGTRDPHLVATPDRHATHDNHGSSDREPAPKPSHHVNMPCCCAAGSASLAAIPASTPELQVPRQVRLSVLALMTAAPLSPRYRWPRLNPRASPLA